MGKKDNIPKYPVPSGSYVVSERKNEMINAYLGTCVGVSICDRHAGVGGLIHLLLPEPLGDAIPVKPENYAMTGLPFFLKALCDKGASHGKLEACVAGGALVGTLSKLDLDLDIGGRTVEIVEKTLHKDGIPILKSETGGLLGCRLDLNLKTLESYIVPIITSINPVESSFVKPTAEHLDEAVKSVCSIPQIVLKVLRMLREDIHSFQEMATEIRQDQVISAKVISMCNSAYFARKVWVDSIDRALVIVGEKQLLKLIVSAAFEDFFSLNGQGYSLCKGGLFKHALGTAMICEQLAIFTGKAASDIAYTAGLLHDIGKVVLDQYMGKTYPLFYSRVQNDSVDLIVIEREVFGVAHNEMGRRLAERWSLPEGLADVIGNHHCPEEAYVDPELTHLVYLADLLMSRFVVGQELERLDTKSLTSRLRALGLSPEEFPLIVERIPPQLFSHSFGENPIW